MIVARKPGKLPGELLEKTYSLEYGKNSLSIQKKALKKYNSYAIIDDLLATGGTVNCVAKIVESNNKKIAGILIETSVLNNTVSQFTIGIGVNIKSRPNNLKYYSTSLFENGLRIKAHKLFFSIIKRLYFYIENYKNIEFLYLSKKLSDRFFNKKSLINVCNGNYKNEGLFSKIGCMGELIIKIKNKKLTITYGEII